MANEIKNLNSFIVTGEVLDLINYKCFNEGMSNESWGYTLRIETNPETQESVDVEFFTSVNSKKINDSMTTIYNEVRTRSQHKEGDIVRCTGKLTSGDYYSKGELVKKVVLSGDFCNRKGEKGNEKYDFTPCATFYALGMVREIIEDEDKLTLDTLVNEYKTKNGKIRGHYIDFTAEGDGIKGVKSTIKVTKEKVDADLMVLKLSGKITKEIETIKVDESTIVFEDEEGAWGEELERIQASNERKRKLIEEGMKKETVKLLLTGAKKGLTKEEIEENEINFSEYDIEDMVADVEDRLDKSKERDAKKNGIVSDDNVPF